MKKKHKLRFGAVMKFVIMVFVITLISVGLTTGIAIILYVTGVLKEGRQNPILSLLLLFLSSLVIGTVLAAILGRKTYKHHDAINNALHEISHGNFNVRVEIAKGPANVKELAENINITAEELKNLEMMRSDFISDFSHEFKTPIVSINGFAKRLLTKKLTKKEQEEYLKIIYEESSRLAQLATNTLQMSKLENTSLLSNKNEYLLDEQIRNCVILLEKKWSKKNIDIKINLESLLFYGNEELTQQIWINILDNSIKYSNENGSISIDGSLHENGVVVSITDTGIGMDEKTLAHIFDKYYQGNTSRIDEGNGLGLSVVKQIINLHEGKIDVISHENVGTTFIITLPKLIQDIEN